MRFTGRPRARARPAGAATACGAAAARPSPRFPSSVSTDQQAISSSVRRQPFAPAGGGVHAADVDGARASAGHQSFTTSATGAGELFQLLRRQRKTPFGCPAAAQISPKRNSSRSISVTGGVRAPAVPRHRSKSRSRPSKSASRAPRNWQAVTASPTRLVARGDDQHRGVVGHAAEDHALGDLPHARPARRPPLRSARSHRPARPAHVRVAAQRPSAAATRREPSSPVDSCAFGGSATPRLDSSALRRARDRRAPQHAEM